MLTRIQLRASGKTAHEVEAMLRVSMDAIEASLDLTGSVTDQFIEGTPGKSFDGRLVYTIKAQSTVNESDWPARPEARDPVPLKDAVEKAVNG